MARVLLFGLFSKSRPQRQRFGQMIGNVTLRMQLRMPCLVSPYPKLLHRSYTCLLNLIFVKLCIFNQTLLYCKDEFMTGTMTIKYIYITTKIIVFYRLLDTEKFLDISLQ